MDRGLRGERLRQVDRRELGRVERADALSEDERPGERLLRGYLLVDGEADEQRERIAREHPARLEIVGEVERLGHQARSYFVRASRPRASARRKRCASAPPRRPAARLRSAAPGTAA